MQFNNTENITKYNIIVFKQNKYKNKIDGKCFIG